MENTLKLVVLGHIDHGKSTLIGRLLSDAGALPEGRIEQVKAMCARRGMAFEWAFVLDALQIERDQNVTLDTTQVSLMHAAQRYQLIDVPGHQEFLRNLLTGAAQADAAILVVEAGSGLSEQARRQASVLSLLGIRQVVVAVNKMDAAGYAEAAFARASSEASQYLASLGVRVSQAVPVSAREGENLIRASEKMPFYTGAPLMAELAKIPNSALPSGSLRFPVQDVYKFDDRRVLVGRVESGVLAVGDELKFSPSGVRARVASFEAWPDGGKKTSAQAGESIGITLDNPVFVARGQVAHAADSQPALTHLFRGRLLWLGREALMAGSRHAVRIGQQEMMAEVREIEAVIDPDTLAREAGKASLARNQIADVVFRTRALVAADAFADFPATGRFSILEHHRIAGCGTIDLTGFRDQRTSQGEVKSTHLTPVAQNITSQQRAKANGHAGGILWFTGLSGSGKTTLAQGLQQQLFARGCQVFVLDGDNIRRGLCRDLGFSPEDREENLRRAGEVAALFAQAGFIVITSFISPTHADRAAARAAAAEYFHSVYIKADLATCEARDAKGLYKKARSGEITQFTGISAPYEPPERPDLEIDTMTQDVQVCLRQLMRYVEREFIAPQGDAQ